MFYMVCSGVVCFVASGFYSIVSKQKKPIAGFCIAVVVAVPAMVANSILAYWLWFLLDLIGVTNMPFNPYDLRLVLPVCLFVVAVVRKPRRLQKQTFEQGSAKELAPADGHSAGGR